MVRNRVRAPEQRRQAAKVLQGPMRRAFETACRIWAAQEYEAERVSIFTLRTALYQRARSLQRDLASERSKTPQRGARPDGPLGRTAPMADVR